jgi:DNA-directed RNA polymerase subunit RPC12/RpoP
VTTFYFCEDCGTQFINFEDVNQKPVECEECQHTEFMEFYSKSAADKKFALAIEAFKYVKAHSREDTYYYQKAEYILKKLEAAE